MGCIIIADSKAALFVQKNFLLHLMCSLCVAVITEYLKIYILLNNDSSIYIDYIICLLINAFILMRISDRLPEEKKASLRRLN